MNGKGSYTIKQASGLSRLPPSTLRFWEKEFSEFLIPMRTSGGQRRYQGEDLTVIQKIKKMREEGISITGIKKELQSQNGHPESTSNPEKIELLASRVAEVVKVEVVNFFKTEKGAG